MVQTAYTIQKVIRANDNLLQQGSYIVMTNANARPPHLSLLIEGNLFSLGVRGPKLATPLALQLRIIHSRKIETLFLKLDTELFFHNNQLFKAAQTHTLAYSRVEVGVATCLSPIKNFCAAIFDIDISKVNSIFDLLPILNQHKLITSCAHYNLEHLLDGTNFHLQTYSMEDIYNSIVQSEYLTV
jgi:hypothetical protein